MSNCDCCCSTLSRKRLVTSAAFSVSEENIDRSPIIEVMATRAIPKGFDMKVAFRLCMAVVAIRVAAAQRLVARVLAFFCTVSTCVWKVDSCCAAACLRVYAAVEFFAAAFRTSSAVLRSLTAVFSSSCALSIAFASPLFKVACKFSWAAATPRTASSTI